MLPHLCIDVADRLVVPQRQIHGIGGPREHVGSRLGREGLGPRSLEQPRERRGMDGLDVGIEARNRCGICRSGTTHRDWYLRRSCHDDFPVREFCGALTPKPSCKEV